MKNLFLFFFLLTLKNFAYTQTDEWGKVESLLKKMKPDSTLTCKEIKLDLAGNFLTIKEDDEDFSKKVFLLDLKNKDVYFPGDTTRHKLSDFNYQIIHLNVLVELLNDRLKEKYYWYSYSQSKHLNRTLTIEGKPYTEVTDDSTYTSKFRDVRLVGKYSECQGEIKIMKTDQGGMRELYLDGNQFNNMKVDSLVRLSDGMLPCDSLKEIPNVIPVIIDTPKSQTLKIIFDLTLTDEIKNSDGDICDGKVYYVKNGKELVEGRFADKDIFYRYINTDKGWILFAYPYTNKAKKIKIRTKRI